MPRLATRVAKARGTPLTGGGTSPWVPTDLGSALRAWYGEPSQAGAYTFSGSDTWADLSGAARHASYTSVTGSGVSVAAGGLNSRKVLTYAGNGDGFMPPADVLSASTAASALVIYKNGTTGRLAPLGRFGSSGETSHWPVNSTDFLTEFGTDARKTYTITGTDFSVWRIVFLRTAASIHELWIDGSQVGSTITSNTVAWGGSPRFGVDFSATAGYDGQIAAIVLVDGNLSTANQQKLEGWAAQYGALTGNLPGGHPYKSTGPTSAGGAPPTLTITTQPTGGTAGTSTSVVVGNAVGTGDVVMTQVVASSGVSTGSTLRQAPSGGSATFSSVTRPAAGTYKHIATQQGALPVATSSYTTTAGGSALVFTSQPTTGAAGGSMTVAVAVPGGTSGNVSFQIKDSSNANVGSAVTATPSGGSASASLTRPASVATGYYVVASVTGASSATSSTFDSTTSGVGTFAGTNIYMKNDGASTLATGETLFAANFNQGEIQPGESVVASYNGSAQSTQVDWKRTHSDGSLAFGLITAPRPSTLAAGSAATYALAKGSPLTGSDVNLATAIGSHTFSVSIAVSSPSALAAGSPYTFNVISDLTAYLAGAPTYWMKGPLATQARVIKRIGTGSSLRVIADVTAFASGGLAVDLIFANDIAMETTVNHGDVVYTATVTFNGSTVATETLNAQYQYMSWHRKFYSSGCTARWNDPLGTGMHYRPHLPRMHQVGITVEYDPEFAPNSVYSTNVDSRLAGQPGVFGTNIGQPQASNGLNPNIPSQGGRPELGFIPSATYAWWKTGQFNYAKLARHMAEADNHIPTHHWDQNHGRWLSTKDYPLLWAHYTAGVGNPANANTGGMTQLPKQYNSWTDPNTGAALPGTAGWVLDVQHMPALSPAHYSITGERWLYDNVMSRAGFGTICEFTQQRTEGSPFLTVDNLTGGGYFPTAMPGAGSEQLRGTAWMVRDIMDGAFHAIDGDTMRTHLTTHATGNFHSLYLIRDVMDAAMDDMTGFYPGAYFDRSADAGALANQWQNVYMMQTLLAAEKRYPSNTDLPAIIDWMSKWNIGRFEQSDMPWQNTLGWQFRFFNTSVPGSPVLLPSYATAQTEMVRVGLDYPNVVTGGQYDDGDYTVGNMGGLGLHYRWYLARGDTVNANRALAAYYLIADLYPAMPNTSRGWGEDTALYPFLINGDFNQHRSVRTTDPSSAPVLSGSTTATISVAAVAAHDTSVLGRYRVGTAFSATNTPYNYEITSQSVSNLFGINRYGDLYVKTPASATTGNSGATVTVRARNDSAASGGLSNTITRTVTITA